MSFQRIRGAWVGVAVSVVETLDVIAFESAAIAPDVDVVFLHGDHEHGAGDGASNRGGVEIVDAGGRDVERAGLQGGDAFGDELLAAINKTGFFGAVLEGTAGDLVVIRPRPVGRGWRCRAGIAPLARIQWMAALVSSPPGSMARPTFFAGGRF